MTRACHGDISARLRRITTLLLLICGLLSLPVRASAADPSLEPAADAGWKAAYADYLTKFDDWRYHGEDFWYWYRYSLVDVDDDGVPELFLITEDPPLISYLLDFDGTRVCESSLQFGRVSYIPGQNRIRVAWLADGRAGGDMIFRLVASGAALLEEGNYTLSDAGNNSQDESDYHWNNSQGKVGSYPGNSVPVTKEEYDRLLREAFDESRAVPVEGEYASREELMEALEVSRTAAPGDKYAPYPTVALRSVTNDCYLTCNIGAMGSDGKYEKYNDPDVRINASRIQWYEMFRLFPCSDGSVALLSEANWQFISRGESLGWRGLYGRDDFIEDQHKLRIEEDGAYVRLQFSVSGDWITRDGDTPRWDADRGKAELFELITLDDNAYDAGELALLTGPEMFNIDGTGVGYWDIQAELGGGKTTALNTLGYTVMKDKNSSLPILKYENMECVVGVKYLSDERMYDVIIAFQGTGGYGDDWAADAATSADHLGTAKEGFHAGYLEMAQLLQRNEEDITALLGRKQVDLMQLLEEGRKGRAHFTILGHSMGGAIAQIYAWKLYISGIDTSRIRGRTFNPALAMTFEDNGLFGDWYNLCVTSDSVARGLVKFSINAYGIHRLGRTVWLYDDEPDRNTEDKGPIFGVGNIVEAKHNMDRKLQEILEYFSRAGGNYHVRPLRMELSASTDTTIYAAPKSDSEEILLAPAGSRLLFTGCTANEYGELWLRVESFTRPGASAASVRLPTPGYVQTGIPTLGALFGGTASSEPAGPEREESGNGAASQFRGAGAGDRIVFGRYEQDNDRSNGPEPIEWKVLAREGNRILVVSLYGLDCQPFDEENKADGWKDCSLRRWLNEDFLSAAFSREEREAIPVVDVPAVGNSYFNIEADPGGGTRDRLFCLSAEEMHEYMDTDGDYRNTDPGYYCVSTAYAEANGAATYPREVPPTVAHYAGQCGFWLRNPARDEKNAMICTMGLISYSGLYYYLHDTAVRPAMWISVGG